MPISWYQAQPVVYPSPQGVSECREANARRATVASGYRQLRPRLAPGPRSTECTGPRKRGGLRKSPVAAPRPWEARVS